MKRTLIIAGCFLVIFVSLSYVLLKDDKYQSSQELEIQYTEIPESENGFYLLNNASNGLVLNQADEAYLSDVIQENKAWDRAISLELLRKNQDSLGELEKIIKMNSYVYPREYVDNRNQGNPIQLKKWESLAALQLVKCLAGKNDENLDEAFAQTVVLLKVGSLIQKGKGLISNYIIGAYYKNLGYQSLDLLLKDKFMNSELTAKIKDVVEDGSYHEKALVDTLKTELSFAFAQIESMAGKYRNRWLFKPNQTKRIFDEEFSVMINHMDSSWVELSKQHPNGESGFSKTYAKLFPWENKYGKELYNQLRLSWKDIFYVKSKESFDHDATLALIQLKKFANDQGRLPQRLNELVPVYLERIPEDPFDGKQIRYSPTAKTIYYIGFNLDKNQADPKFLLKFDDLFN
jgi:hypothetical protein